MAKKKIGLEVDVPVGEAEKGLKSLKLQLRELKEELQSMDEADPKFTKLARQAGELEDKIKSVNEQVAAFAGPANERALSGIIGVTQGIAGGFAAAQGAAALFADENEDVQKSLLKVQAALALLNGIQEIQNTLKKESAARTFLAATAQKAYTLAVGSSTGVLKVFRLALISTGIGALVVVLGLIITNWTKFRDAVFSIVPGLKQVAEFIGAFVQAVTDAVGITSELDRQLERMNAATAIANGNLQRTVQVMEAMGGKEKEVFEIRKQIIANEIALIEARSFAEEEDAERYLELITQRQVLDAGEANRLAGIEKDRQQKNKEAAKKREEDAKKEADKVKAERDRINAIILEAQRSLELGTLEGQARELRALELTYEDKLAAVVGNEEATKLLTAQYEQERQAIRDQYAAIAREKRDQQYEEDRKKKKEEDDAKIELEKQYQQALFDLKVSATLGIVDALKTLNESFEAGNEAAARRRFAITKALSLAETVISTYAAAQTAFTNTLANPAWKLSPDGGLTAAYVAAGLAVAGGLARVVAISRQQFQGGAQVSNTGTGGGSASQPPSTPQITQDITRTRIGEGDSGEGTLKVFVTESDITRTQDRVRRIENRATVR